MLWKFGYTSRVVLFLRVCSIRPFLFGPSYSGRESTEIFELERETRGWKSFVNRKGFCFPVSAAKRKMLLEASCYSISTMYESKIKD